MRKELAPFGSPMSYPLSPRGHAKTVQPEMQFPPANLVTKGMTNSARWCEWFGLTKASRLGTCWKCSIEPSQNGSPKSVKCGFEMDLQPCSLSGCRLSRKPGY